MFAHGIFVAVWQVCGAWVTCAKALISYKNWHRFRPDDAVTEKDSGQLTQSFIEHKVNHNCNKTRLTCNMKLAKMRSSSFLFSSSCSSSGMVRPWKLRLS